MELFYSTKIKDNKIIDLGPAEKNTFNSNEVIDGYNKLCMPGLVNSHTHAGMTLYRGVADDLPLMTWLNDHIWPLEAHFGTEKSVKVGTELALIGMLRSGTTTFCAESMAFLKLNVINDSPVLYPVCQIGDV